MPSPYLSKSDFKACLDCPTKLYYRKNAYPSALDDDEYLRFLADGGFMVEFIAKAQYPGGIDLVDERDPAQAFRRTRELLMEADCTLFEAAALAGKYYVRTDILRRRGRILDLIEVKSSSIADDDECETETQFLTKKGTVAARWKSYLMDVAFQTLVLRTAFPTFEVRPHLCLVNKSHRVQEAETLAMFSLDREKTNPKSRPRISYSAAVDRLIGSKLLSVHPVHQEVQILMPEVEATARGLGTLLSEAGVERVAPNFAENYSLCRTCEYRTNGMDRSGFRECWGELASAAPHILDLHRVGQVARRGEPDPITALLRRGRASVLDLSETDLGAAGSFRDRRYVQWKHSGEGTEWLSDHLRAELDAHRSDPGWPLHFLDFEACNIALPHHAGLRPYERVAFQWSCHTVSGDGSVSHQEWLNTERVLPNFAFAASLRECIGESGTVYVWSPYEQSTLNRVLIQIGEWIHRDCEEAVRASGLGSREALMDLARWIEQLLGPEDEKGARRHSPRIRDLHALALKHYFHPRMGGRTSIKVVLPAIWETQPEVYGHPWFRKYLQFGSDGTPIDPYKTLPALPLGEADDDVVREGSGAVRVYQDLIFREQTPEERETRRKLLLQYCELDTAAMLAIWLHWRGGAHTRQIAG